MQTTTRKPRPVTEERKAQALALRDAGLSVREIGQLLRLSESMAGKLVYRQQPRPAGKPGRPRFSPEERAEAFRLFRAGWGFADIARRMGRSERSVAHVVVAQDLEEEARMPADEPLVQVRPFEEPSFERNQE